MNDTVTILKAAKQHSFIVFISLKENRLKTQHDIMITL